MNLRTPFLTKIVLGGAGSALLGLAALGAAPAAFAATPQPAAASAARPNPSDHRGHREDARQDRRQIRRAVFEAEADALGMKPEELRDALRAGRSVSELAEARGLSERQVAERMVSSLKPVLDRLVDEKKITRQQADRVLDRLAKGHVPGWHRHHDRDHHHSRGDRTPQQ